MGMQSLAKSVILQSIDDLYDKRYSDESLRFFSSNDFTFLAELAGMDDEEKITLLHMVHKVKSHLGKRSENSTAHKTGRAKPSPRSLPVPSHL
jgi:hypothetical protein